MTKLLATSVVRGAAQGQSHGGIYLVDLETETFEQKLDWNNCKINFTGRGGDRGLRGITFYNDAIYIAASDEIFILEKNFKIQTSFRNPYLKHCHEICIFQNRLYLSSTGFDSILVYNLITNEFSAGIFLDAIGQNLVPLVFDPTTSKGPRASNQFHVNAITCDANGIVFCGRKLGNVHRLHGTDIDIVGRVPLGTHNAQLYDGGILYNDTESNKLVYECGGVKKNILSPIYEHREIKNIENFASDIARPCFARGLAVLPKNRIAFGTSPSTISVCNLETEQIEKTINISMDVRNAIHGLEVYPYS